MAIIEYLKSPKFIAILIASLILGFSLIWFLITAPILGKTEKKQAPKVDTQRLVAHVNKLAVDLHSRNYEEIEKLNSAAYYINMEFARFGLDTSQQVFQVENQIYKNVSAFVGPDTKQRLVIGAHYDVYGSNPGADDNASGVAGLLELGRILSENPPSIRVELVAYSLEEPPFFRTQDMGSAHHAQVMTDAGVDVKVMISLEMIGYFSDEPNSQAYPSSFLSLFYPNRGNFITVVGKLGENNWARKAKTGMRSTSDLPVFSINAPSFIPGIDFSDHLNYWKHDIPALMITDTSFYRNPFYHTGEDLPETLDFQKMAQVVQGVYGVILEFSEE